MEHLHFAGKFQIPTYAIPMLEYGDTTGLTNLDVEEINKFIGEHFPYGFAVEWTGIDQPYFSSRPALGTAGEVIDANFYYFPAGE